MIEIVPIRNYPDNGKHLQCNTLMPFCIRKGEDGYYWTDKTGKEQKYNMTKGKIDDRWIVHLKGNCNNHLMNMFEIKVSKSLDIILEYCVSIYLESLKHEIQELMNVYALYLFSGKYNNEFRHFFKRPNSNI